ncbi:MAG: GvpL/GvpF family gas vesicle protein [Deltaproteobacteria bacterium]
MRNVPSLLHVAVPAAEGTAATGRALGARSVVSGPLAAVVGPVRREGATRVALRHARIVAGALAACSSVVPFRLGIELASDQEVRELLAENRAELCARLEALAGCVEMGLKVRVPASAPGSSRLEDALARVRALAPPAHRRESRRPVADGQVLEACYLLPRDRIEPFWAEVASLRSYTGFPVLGTGPWAPYTFSDISLRPAPRATPGDPILDRRPS